MASDAAVSVERARAEGVPHRSRVKPGPVRMQSPHSGKRTNMKSITRRTFVGVAAAAMAAVVAQPTLRSGQEDPRLRRQRSGRLLDHRPPRHREGAGGTAELQHRVLRSRRDVGRRAEAHPGGPARQGRGGRRDQPGEPGQFDRHPEPGRLQGRPHHAGRRRAELQPPDVSSAQTTSPPAARRAS